MNTAASAAIPHRTLFPQGCQSVRDDDRRPADPGQRGHESQGQDRDKNIEAPIPSRAVIGLADSVFLNFEAANEGTGT